MTVSKLYHVVKSSKDGWTVIRSGASRATRLTSTKQDAVKYAQKLAKKDGTGLFVHKKDGTISHVDNYKSDRHRQLDKK